MTATSQNRSFYFGIEECFIQTLREADYNSHADLSSSCFNKRSSEENEVDYIIIAFWV